MLVPSFSSKGFPEANNILKVTREVIEGPILVSAYDLSYKQIIEPLTFPSLVFLDSGGYEASKDLDLSDAREREHLPALWTREQHEHVLQSYKQERPTALITYDHPKERYKTSEQIERANSLFCSHPGFVREILLKPESEGAIRVKVQSIIAEIHALANFDVIGVTEKEIGNSIFDRMKNIAKIRIALMNAGLETPIHVFGSLDTITTPLYFLAGADIFDGLTWLRFAYRDGYTIYRQNYGAVEFGISSPADVVEGRCWNSNYGYLKELELEMSRFLKDFNYKSFKYHSSLFETACENTLEAVGH